MDSLAARALAISAQARVRATSDRERNRAECPAMHSFWDEWTAKFGRFQYMNMTEGGRTVGYGTPPEYTRAVQASAAPKPGKLLRERR